MKTLSILILLFMCSCVSFSEDERHTLTELKTKQIKAPVVKDPLIAGSLALLPGGGLYVAGKNSRPSGLQEDSVGIASMINWGLWPVSILWAVPQSYIDAQSVNEKELLFNYRNR